jgi:hypothetical protein
MATAIAKAPTQAGNTVAGVIGAPNNYIADVFRTHDMINPIPVSRILPNFFSFIIDIPHPSLLLSQ